MSLRPQLTAGIDVVLQHFVLEDGAEFAEGFQVVDVDDEGAKDVVKKAAQLAQHGTVTYSMTHHPTVTSLTPAEAWLG